jgi:peptidoglycan hydrolase-like protein with peptidoglycan-binding domain
MFKWKRSLLLRSLSLSLLAGLTFTSATAGFPTAFANCNSTATGSWSNNCQTSQGNISLFTVAIQTVINYSGTRDPATGNFCTTGTIDGHFGTNKFNGVECFQDAKHIGDDGIVGPITWGKLESVLICTGMPPVPCSAICQGTALTFS